MTKQISAFANLCQEDQVYIHSVFKGSVSKKYAIVELNSMVITSNLTSICIPSILFQVVEIFHSDRK